MAQGLQFLVDVVLLYQRMLERLQTDLELRKEIEKLDSSMSNVNRLTENSNFLKSASIKSTS